MTGYQFFIAYVFSWWLVLFMVLPWKVKLAEKPVVGHAASAPEKPMLKRKFLITTLLATIPPLLIYLFVPSAHAAEPDMYHAGRGKCRPVTTYHAPADINAKDTVTMHDPNNVVGDMKNVNVGINVPTGDYTNPPQDPNDPNKPNGVDLRDSEIGVGTLSVDTQDGSMKFNGKDIAPQQQYEGCE